MRLPRQQQIKEIQYKINSRHRKNLNFFSPKEIFFQNLQNNKLHSDVETTALTPNGCLIFCDIFTIFASN